MSSLAVTAPTIGYGPFGRRTIAVVLVTLNALVHGHRTSVTGWASSVGHVAMTLGALEFSDVHVSQVREEHVIRKS